MAESIELATILVTDLVGSTRLATSVGPARADELRDEHFAVLREAIGASGGREFKNTGDGLMVAFNSASAAVRCAVSMQQLIERRYRRAEQKLQVRIGLGAGESTVQDGNYFGMPSIEAARLCAKAPADGILVSPAVRMLATRLDGIRFDSVGELELKGFPEPVEAFAVPWTKLADEAAGVGGWPLPALMRSAPRAAFVGREDGASARGALAQRGARGTRGRWCWSPASPGSARAACRRSPRTARTARGSPCCGARARRSWRCRTSRGSRCARSSWSTHLRTLLERHVERHGGELARLARELPRRLPDAPEPESSDPETERFLLFSAVAGRARRVGGVGAGVPRARRSALGGRRSRSRCSSTWSRPASPARSR